MSFLDRFMKPRASVEVQSIPEELAPEQAGAPQRRILLVGDDFDWLARHNEIAQRRIIRAQNGVDALRVASAPRLDGVVVSFRDVKQSLEALNVISASFPTLSYFLRADSAEIKGGTISHPVLQRTQSREVLSDTLQTLFALADWRRNQSLSDVYICIRILPALPSLYSQITAALQSGDFSLEAIADLVAKEPAVGAKLLQFVNSPLFSLNQKVTSIAEATVFFGLDRLRALVLSTSMFAQFDASKCRSFSLEQFISNSDQIAMWASAIAVGETGDKQLGEMAFTGGLLHNFGVLLLAANLPESYDQILRIAKDQRISIARVEREAYQISHADLAGYILASWGLPFAIVNAVGFYDLPSRSEDTSFSSLTAVHAATVIDTFARTGVLDFDRGYIERLNFSAKLEEWCKRLTGKVWVRDDA
ncbi:MAG: hypothetical protein QOE70_1915 [Chthoniobacter sp.]|jgi:HD-like signal output (HDOD) protein|nr:hypothetical protein [Chthoniobacter sp.]